MSTWRPNCIERSKFLIEYVSCSVKRANEEQYTQKEAEAGAGKTVEVYEPIRRDENGIPI